MDNKEITVEINGDASGLEAVLDKAIEKADKLNLLLREASEILRSFHAMG
jgi:hypothetical protein